MNPMSLRTILMAVTLATLTVADQPSTGFAPELFQELTWRNIGPFRGGRTKAAAGIPTQPHVF